MSRPRLLKSYDLKVALKTKECRGRRAASLLPRGEKDRMRGFGTCRIFCSARTPSPHPLPSGERECACFGVARMTASALRACWHERQGAHGARFLLAVPRQDLGVVADFNPGGAGGAGGVRYFSRWLQGRARRGSLSPQRTLCFAAILT